ncbi:MAG: hypothetical protein SCH39_02270 [Methanosarcinales archaeon]|nr:hypothetical protein [ANME-2 cluster archaeon]MDW7775145.1 hypothetical protein [Methanosarcinales archaeon]
MRDRIEWELKGLNEGGIVLALTSAKNYNEANIDFIKYLVYTKNEPGVYLTFNKPYATMKQILEDENIDPRMIIFIDAITLPSGGKTDDSDRCLYLSDLRNLSDLAVIIDEAVEAIPYKNKFLFLDSLSTLLLYNNTGSAAKFVHFLTGKLRAWKLDAIFLSLELESDAEFLAQLTLFCDKKINLSELQST